MFDPKCLLLADYFLLDCAKATEFDAHRLAQAIQDTVEDFFLTELKAKPDTRRKGGA